MNNPFETIETRLTSIESQLSEISTKLSATSTNEKKFYSVDHAAQKLGIASITMYRNIQAGKIPSKKVGGRILIPGSFCDK